MYISSFQTGLLKTTQFNPSPGTTISTNIKIRIAKIHLSFGAASTTITGFRTFSHQL